MFSRHVGNHRSFPDHVRHPRTQHSSTSCWQCSSLYQPWELWQECHCYCIAEHKISQPPGANRIARALGHTHALRVGNTDQLGVVRFTPKIPFSKHMWTVCRGQSISAPCFMYLVPHICLSYMLAGRAYPLASQSMLCGLSVYQCSDANNLILHGLKEREGKKRLL